MRGESSSMSSNRHGAADDTADTAAAAFVAVGGGPIVMTGISLSGLPGWTDGAPAARGFRGMNSNICLSGNHAALLTRLCLRLSFPVVANSDVLKLDLRMRESICARDLPITNRLRKSFQQ